MKLTLKVKFYYLIMSMAVLFLIIGIVTMINFLSASKEIENLMNSNYKCIEAAEYMSQISLRQFNLVSSFVYGKNDYKKEFELNIKDFNRWLDVEIKNVSDKNQKKIVLLLKKNYTRFIKNSIMLKNLLFESDNEKLAYFSENISSIFMEISDNITAIRKENEKSIMNSKQVVADKSKSVAYLIIGITIIILISGSMLAMYIANRFLRPLYSLRRFMSRGSNGETDLQAPLMSNDEVKEMTEDFNEIMIRLSELEKNELNKICSEKNYSLTILKNMPEPIVVMNSRMKIEFVNSEFENIFNITEDIVMGKELFEFISNIDLYGFLFEFSANETQTDSKTVKLERRDIQDEYLYYTIFVSKVKDEHSNIIGTVLSFNDITSIRKNEKIKNSVIAAISHEFKMPVKSLLMGANILESGTLGEINQEQKELLEKMKSDSETLIDMVQSLLRIKEYESKDMLFDFQPVNIKKIISESVRYFENRIKNEYKKLELIVKDDLPDVYADKEKIRLVLNNLLSNAIKFTDKNDTILIRAYTKNNYMYVEVVDTGKGIPEDEIDKIFDKYYQIEDGKSRMKADGSGIGLTITRDIIKEHEGEIWAESRVGEGTRFVFTLKLNYN